MNVRIEHKYTFQAVAHLDDTPQVNTYHIVLSLVTAVESSEDQNIAFERVHCWFEDILTNAVFVKDSDTDAIKNYAAAGFRVVELPETPFDQIIGFMLMSKLNAIMEGRLVLTDISVSSTIGKGVAYLLADEEETPLDIIPFWWDSSLPNWSDAKVSNKGDKVVKLAATASWREFELEFPSDTASEAKPVTDKGNLVVKFTNDPE